jgi:aryl-phospho-beta-D-glucosidase BglC (GH1 family)
MQFRKIVILVIFFSIIAANISTFHKPFVSLAYAQRNQNSSNNSIENDPFIGVNMRGYYTTMSQTRGDYSIPLPLKYYEESFKLLSEAGMNHVRYRFYWESYVRDPFLTITLTASRANGLSIASFGFTEIQTKCSIQNSLDLLVSNVIICS